MLRKTQGNKGPGQRNGQDCTGAGRTNHVWALTCEVRIWKEALKLPGVRVRLRRAAVACGQVGLGLAGS